MLQLSPHDPAFVQDPYPAYDAARARGPVLWWQDYGMHAAFDHATVHALIPAYCQQVPVRVIARLLGVPEAMGPDLLRWSSAMVAMYQAGRTRAIEDAANSAAAEFATFLRGYIDASRNAPRGDLITRLIAAASGPVMDWLTDEVGLSYAVNPDGTGFFGHSINRLHSLPTQSGVELSGGLQTACEAAGVAFEWKPFLLGPVFHAKGLSSSPFVLDPIKGAYMWRDVERRAAILEVDINFVLTRVRRVDLDRC